MSNLYSKDPISIDYSKCIAAGSVLSRYQNVIESSVWSLWDKERVLTFKLVFIAICHDINWDFLQNTLANIFEKEPQKLQPSYLKGVNAATIKTWLSGYDKPERIRAAGRSKLLKNIGQILISDFDGSSINLVTKSRGVLFGPNGFYALLGSFTAYSEDPLRKKSNVLVHDLVRERLCDFSDIEEVDPAVEYHIMRLYERTGRILPKRKELHKALINGEPLTQWFVSAFRRSTSEALIYTARVANKTVPDVNYIEWQIARNVCTLYEPSCLYPHKTKDELPTDIQILFTGSCPYIDFCFAYNENRESLKLREPIPRNKKSFY